MIEWMIVIGFALILIGFIFALPFFGIGMVIPILGDLIDLPLSAVLVGAGIIFLLIGGLLSVIINYWWIALLAVIIYGAIMFIKTGFAFKKTR